MLHSLAQDGECLGNMLLHGVGTDAQPVGCLLIGEMLEIAEAEYRAGGFLQLPRNLLRLLQQALVLLILGTHIIPGGLYQRLYIGLFHLLVLEPVETGISHLVSICKEENWFHAFSKTSPTTSRASLLSPKRDTA